MAAILVVDDHPAVGEMLEAALSMAGHQPCLASTYADARGLLLGRQFDLVVCDVLLPRKSGFEVCFEIKRAPAPRGRRLL